jgi:hypothetical protein
MLEAESRYYSPLKTGVKPRDGDSYRAGEIHPSNSSVNTHGTGGRGPERECQGAGARVQDAGAGRRAGGEPFRPPHVARVGFKLSGKDSRVQWEACAPIDWVSALHDSAQRRHTSAQFANALSAFTCSHAAAQARQISAQVVQILEQLVERRAVQLQAAWQISAQSCSRPMSFGLQQLPPWVTQWVKVSRQIVTH